MLGHLESKATEALMDQEAAPKHCRDYDNAEQPSLSKLKHRMHLGQATANTMGMGRDQKS